MALQVRHGRPVVPQPAQLFSQFSTAGGDHATLTGRPCARLQTDYELPLDLSLAGAGLLRLAGKQTGNQVAYFDHEAGRVLRFDGASDTSLTMSAPPLFGTAGAQQSLVALTLRSTTSAVLQPQAAE